MHVKVEKNIKTEDGVGVGAGVSVSAGNGASSDKNTSKPLFLINYINIFNSRVSFLIF